MHRIYAELARNVRKWRITTGGFAVSVGHSPHVLGRDVRRDLLLPPIAKLNEVIFNDDFATFMKRVVKDPSSKHVHRVRNATADVTITYDSTRELWGGTHLAYTVTNIIDDNPVFHALRSKARHLKQSGYGGLRGVILCDGGCQLLREGGSSSEYSLQQVVADFMRQNRSVGFVVAIGVQGKSSIASRERDYRATVKIWVAKAHAAKKETLSAFFDKIVPLFPPLETSPSNALNRVLSGSPMLGSFFGGYEMGGIQYMRISAVGLLQLLAGNVSYSDFAKAHGFEERNPFAQAVRGGRVIRSSRIESGGTKDDDWIVFEFGATDAALAPFVPSEAAQSTKDNG